MDKPFLLFSNGVLIDLEDADIFLEYNIMTSKSQNRVGLRHKITRKFYSLPRLLMNAPKGMLVDHINMDGLDNRKQNLRIATDSQNCMNRMGTSKLGLPKGVYKDIRRPNRPYGVRICKEGKWKYLSSFTDLQDAVDAYNKAAAEIHGEFHQPSRIDSVYIPSKRAKGNKK